MTRIAFLSTFFVLMGCVHQPKERMDQKSVCSTDAVGSTDFKSLHVLIYPDQHGEYLKIPFCSDRPLPVDFSKSQLFSGKFENLLKQLRFNTFHGGAPIPAKISGTLQKTTRDGARFSKVYVYDILDYGAK